jgi:hypothetical protein
MVGFNTAVVLQRTLAFVALLLCQRQLLLASEALVLFLLHLSRFLLRYFGLGFLGLETPPKMLLRTAIKFSPTLCCSSIDQNLVAGETELAIFLFRRTLQVSSPVKT